MWRASAVRASCTVRACPVCGGESQAFGHAAWRVSPESVPDCELSYRTTSSQYSCFEAALTLLQRFFVADLPYTFYRVALFHGSSCRLCTVSDAPT